MRHDLAAVFFDIGGVILDVDSARAAHRQFVAAVVERHAPGADPEAALETWRAAVGDYFRGREGTAFRPAREAYARGVEAVVGERPPVEAWLPLFEAATGDGLRPEPGARETVAGVAETDLHLGVVSDVDHAEGLRVLDSFGLRPHFDSITTSESVGRTKPDPAMFDAALDAAGVPPERALMIGDRYTHDMEGAARAGLVTVAYGADDGPAVDYRIDDLRELLDLIDAGSA